MKLTLEEIVARPTEMIWQRADGTTSAPAPRPAKAWSRHSTTSRRWSSEGRECLVVGGGGVGLRKVQGLVEEGRAVRLGTAETWVSAEAYAEAQSRVKAALSPAES